MYVFRQVILLGGAFKDIGQNWIVSYWHIPGGWDYNHAEVHLAFFDDKKAAEKFVANNQEPPAMAFLMSRQDYTKAREAARAHDAKKNEDLYAAGEV